MKIPQINYYGLKHDIVNEMFEGDLTFMNTLSINGTAHAIYKAKNPNKKKGHKKYMGLVVNGISGIVTGFTPKKLAEYRYRSVVQCLKCNEIIQSCSQHDYVNCSCGNAMIDGGDSYLRCSVGDTLVLKADLIERKIIG